MIASAVSAFDSMASEYDSWFENKGKLVFNLEIQAVQQGFSSDAGFTVIVASKANQRSNIGKVADKECLP
jgi:hypothetical protein